LSVQVDVNGTSINYPQTGDTGWGDEATQFAIQTGGAFSKLGLDTGTIVDIPGTLDVTGATTLDSTLDVDGATQLNSTLDVTGNTNLSGTLDVVGNTDLNGSLDVASTVTIVDDLAVDTDTLFVDVSADRVGINTAIPTEALDVTGNIKSSGSITGSSATLTNLTVDTDLIKTDSANNRVGINNATPTKALDVTGEILASSDITTGGLLIADDSTSTSAPPITFTGDTNTGIGRSGADTLDFITNGDTRFRIESTGQIKAVFESSLGTDYNTSANLQNGYLCRAWVNFDGTSSNLTGTYSRTGTTITVTILAGHGLSTGQTVYLDFTSGNGTDNIYVVTVTNSTTYTVQDSVSGSTSGNVTQFRYIRASGNVSSITDNGTGDYTINFTTAMPDANYAVIATNGETQRKIYSIYGVIASSGNVSANTSSSVRVITFDDNTNAGIDIQSYSLAVFR
jgi:hypothetical protein